MNFYLDGDEMMIMTERKQKKELFDFTDDIMVIIYILRAPVKYDQIQLLNISSIKINIENKAWVE